MNTGFTRNHPITQLVFFVSVIGVNMIILHPVFLLISFIGGASYICCISGFGKMFKLLGFNSVTALMIIIINPLISHGGVTVLTYLPDGNPLTLESIIFGCAAAVLMTVMINWFSCINKLMTSDRIIYLFGKPAPKLALLISMVLNFSGKLSAHYKEVKDARECLYRASGKKGLIARLRNSVTVFSSIIQWSLENSVDTADSMISRGYGSGKRTSFDLFMFRKQDIVVTALFLVIDVYIIYSYINDMISFSYYPVFTIGINSTGAYIAFVLFFILCMTPYLTEKREARKWKYLQSRI